MPRLRSKCPSEESRESQASSRWRIQGRDRGSLALGSEGRARLSGLRSDPATAGMNRWRVLAVFHSTHRLIDLNQSSYRREVPEQRGAEG